MPTAIPFAVAYAASNAAAAVGATVAAQATIAATAATIAAAAQTAVVIAAASYALTKLTQPSLPKPADGKIDFTQELPIRFFHYGRKKISGPVALFERRVDGDLTRRELFRIVCLSAREIDAVEERWLDDKEVTLDGGGLASPGFDGLVHLFEHLGTDGQAADAAAVAAFSTDDVWTTDHRLRGIANVVCVYSQGGNPADFQFIYPNGIPALACVIRGAKVYDPRKDSTNGGSGSHRKNNMSTWEWSDNQRLCALDWLTYADGYAKGWDRIDWATWVPQIEMADDAIPLKAGGTESRYRLADTVSLDEPKSRVLHRIMQAGDQQLFTTNDGLIGSRGGIWDAPTVTLSVGSRPEAAFTAGVPRMEKCNEFQLTAMLPSHDYAVVDLERWANVADPDWIAGRIKTQPLPLPQVPSNSQAQRLAKIYMARANPRWSGQLRTNFAGLNARGEAVVTLQFDELNQPSGTFNGPFFVNGKLVFLPDKTGMTIAVSSADPDAYDWDEDNEEQDAPPVPPPVE